MPYGTPRQVYVGCKEDCYFTEDDLLQGRYPTIVVAHSDSCPNKGKNQKELKIHDTSLDK